MLFVESAFQCQNVDPKHCQLKTKPKNSVDVFLKSVSYNLWISLKLFFFSRFCNRSEPNPTVLTKGVLAFNNLVSVCKKFSTRGVISQSNSRIRVVLEKKK